MATGQHRVWRCTRCGAGTEDTHRPHARLCTMCGAPLNYSQAYTYIRAKKKGAGIKLVPVSSLQTGRFRQGGAAQARRHRTATNKAEQQRRELIQTLTYTVARRRHGYQDIRPTVPSFNQDELQIAVFEILHAEDQKRLSAAREEVKLMLSLEGFHAQNAPRITILKRLIRTVKRRG